MAKFANHAFTGHTRVGSIRLAQDHRLPGKSGPFGIATLACKATCKIAPVAVLPITARGGLPHHRRMAKLHSPFIGRGVPLYPARHEDRACQL